MATFDHEMGQKKIPPTHVFGGPSSTYSPPQKKMGRRYFKHSLPPTNSRQRLKKAFFIIILCGNETGRRRWLKRPKKKKSYGFSSHEERADTSNEDQKIILSSLFGQQPPTWMACGTKPSKCGKLQDKTFTISYSKHLMYVLPFSRKFYNTYFF